MKFSLRPLALCVAAFFATAVLCMAALFLSGFIPAQTIEDSIRSDYAEIEARGDYPVTISGTPKYRYDGFTDGIMLMQAIPCEQRTALDNMVLAPYHAIGDGTPGGDGTGGISPTQALLNLLDDPDTEQQRTYVLYWHGYVVPLRILLTVLSPMNLIVLNCVIFALLAALVFEAFRRTGGLASGIALIVALLATFSWIAPLGFQFFTSYLIAFLATLVLYWMLQRSKRHQWILPFFLVVGVLTVFFDFLTTPLLTFLLPLALYLLWSIRVREEQSLMKTVSAGAAWLVGYAGFWFTKWLITGALYSFEHANSEFAHALTQRSGIEEGGISYRFAAIYNNLYQLFAAHPDGTLHMTDFFAIVALTLVLLAVIWWLLFRFSGTSKEQLKRALPMLLVVAGPYVWYFAVAHHSTFHSWFTYRLQTASVLAIILFFVISIDWRGLVSDARRTAEEAQEEASHA
ncbi:MAG: hypothetical protein FWC86_05690 [Coriobacteriia bacterium]|nr:hypothetical protein [Coriobacteriia bacterium]